MDSGRSDSTTCNAWREEVNVLCFSLKALGRVMDGMQRSRPWLAALSTTFRSGEHVNLDDSAFPARDSNPRQLA